MVVRGHRRGAAGSRRAASAWTSLQAIEHGRQKAWKHPSRNPAASGGCHSRLQIAHCASPRAPPRSGEPPGGDPPAPAGGGLPAPGRGPPSAVQVAVVGGGPAGLAAACALRARGFDAHVFEAADALLRRGTGTGIMVSANGWRALEACDEALPPALRAAGVQIVRQNITVCDEGGGVVRAFGRAAQEQEQYGHAQYNVPWADAHAVLAARLPEDVVHCGSKALGYRLEGRGEGGVALLLEGGQEVRCAMLVAADGAGSALRAQVAAGASEGSESGGHDVRPTSQLLWNALIPTERLEGVSRELPGVHRAGEVEFVTCGRDGKAILAFDSGADGLTSWYLTLDESDAPQAVRAALRSGGFGGFGHAGRADALREAFSAFPGALALLRATDEAAIFERRLADRQPLSEEQWCDGPVVLLGDAAHPMVPSQGQGTMVAFEDAADLAACLEAAAGAGPAVAAARYARARAARAARIQRWSREAYMGRPSPRLLPLRVLRLLSLRREVGFAYGGYEVAGG